MKIHELKSWPKFFAKVIAGEKTFEVRLNDRDFQVGDFLFLREWDPESKQYSGRFQCVRITYMLGSHDHCAVSPQALHPDYVILAVSLYCNGQFIPPGQKLASDRPEKFCPHDPSCSPIERFIKNGYADMNNWGLCFRN